ncbi:MAG: PH domain-containing protein [Christensenellaceae bacterium]|nr:PH domain-containing protein [Christensenellaceae bacterium]
MAVNFNQNSAWNLKPISTDAVRNEVAGLLINDEEIVMAFQTIRDQLIFTNKRIIAIDVQGLTGKRKSFSTMPYSKIQYFSIQTPGFAEFIPDSELFIMFSNTFTARFEFKGNVDIGRIGRMISEYVLES